MPIFTILLVIAICGLLIWAINAYLPMAPAFKKILNIVAVICLIIWLVKVFNLMHYINALRT